MPTRPVVATYALIVGLLASSCEEAHHPPPDPSAARGFIERSNGCYRSEGGLKNTSVDSSGGTATVHGSITCFKRGEALNDFGASCQNVLGCFKKLKVEATCDVTFHWKNGHWSDDAITCPTANETVVGSVGP